MPSKPNQKMLQESESDSTISLNSRSREMTPDQSDNDIASLGKAHKYATFAATQAEKGNYSDAVEYYTQAIRRDKSNINYYLRRGEAQLNDKKYPEARRDADLAREVENIENLQIAEAHSLSGRARMGLGEFEEAETEFQKAVTIASNEGNQEELDKYQEAIRVNIKQKLMRNMNNCNEGLADQISFISDDIETAVDNYMETVMRDGGDNDDASSITPSILMDAPVVDAGLSLAAGGSRAPFQSGRFSNDAILDPTRNSGQHYEGRDIDLVRGSRFLNDNSQPSNVATSGQSRYSGPFYDRNDDFNMQRPSSRPTRREPLRDSSNADTQSKRSVRARTPARGLRSDQRSQAGSYRNNRRVAASETSDNESIGNRSVRSATSYRSCYNPRQSRSFVISEKDRILPVNIIGWHGVYIRNLDTDVSRDTVQEIFSVFGKIYYCEVKKWDRIAAAYIHYDNPRSPAKAIHLYQGINDARLSYNETRLVMRFTNGYNQERRLINVGSAATRRWTSSECFHWRTNGCDLAIRKCTKDHKPMCRGIDFQPWMLKVIKV